jgi:large subunit ribosomal protein L32e
LIPSGHKSFLVNNVKDLELLLMHNRTHAAEYVIPTRVFSGPSPD